MAWLGSARAGWAPYLLRLGALTRPGWALLGPAAPRWGPARPARLGSVRLGPAWSGSVLLGPVRLGPARLGSVRLGPVRSGPAGGSGVLCRVVVGDLCPY
ncbi:hypothetical protein ACR3S4_00980 [Streptomyces sp. CH8.1]|uniref:hypothetical protein n=1 Tax=Streptomyces sp. CH8.1 TaxID=3439546 RepID=UPI003DA1951D